MEESSECCMEMREWGVEEFCNEGFVNCGCSIVMWCLLLWCCWSGRGFKAFCGSWVWETKLEYTYVMWNYAEVMVSVCVCVYVWRVAIRMYVWSWWLHLCKCTYRQCSLFPFSSSVISNLMWNLRRLPYLRSITAGDFDEGFVNCLVFLCVLWRWFAVWRGFNALAPYYGKPNLNAPIWNFPEVIGCVCCLMCLVQDMCMILVTAFVFV